MTSTVDSDGTAGATSAAPLLFTVPHRFLFLAGVAQLVAVSLGWSWTLAARAWPAVPAPGASRCSSRARWTAKYTQVYWRARVDGRPA